MTLAEYTARSIRLPTSPGLYLKRVDLLRRSFFGPMERLALREMNRQTRATIDEARGAQSVGAVQGLLLQASIQHADAKPIYEGIYTKVVPAFAERILSSLKGLKQDDQWVRLAQEWINLEGASLIRAVNGYTHEEVILRVRPLVAQAIEEGWTVPKLLKSIEERLTGAVNPVRARRIARTEILRASNVGSNAGAEQIAEDTGLVLNKTWLSTSDSRTRDDHITVNGQTVAMDEDFTLPNGETARYPLDPKLSAANSINCRCTTVFTPV